MPKIMIVGREVDTLVLNIGYMDKQFFTWSSENLRKGCKMNTSIKFATSIQT